MKKPVRQLDGFYHVEGKNWSELFGSRIQVMNGTAYKTTGGLKMKKGYLNIIFKIGKYHSNIEYKIL